MVFGVVKHWLASFLSYYFSFEDLFAFILQLQRILHKNIFEPVRDFSLDNLYGEVKWLTNQVLWLDNLLILVEFGRQVYCPSFVSWNQTDF